MIVAIFAVAMFLLVVFGLFNLIHGYQEETPKQAEAHHLLVELGILEEYLPILPAEFKTKLDKYLGGTE